MSEIIGSCRIALLCFFLTQLVEGSCCDFVVVRSLIRNNQWHINSELTKDKIFKLVNKIESRTEDSLLH